MEYQHIKIKQDFLIDLDVIISKLYIREYNGNAGRVLQMKQRNITQVWPEKEFVIDNLLV